MNVKRLTKAEQTEATRRALLDAARALFASKGFADTPTEEIVARAGVTRGALYHHFKDKIALFRAVVEEMEQEVTAKVAEAAMGSGGVWEGLIGATERFLDLCMDPAVRRVLLTEAPAVLGIATWREIERRYGLGLTQVALETAMAEGLIEQQPSEPLAHIVLGAVNEAALTIGAAEDPGKARGEVGAALKRMLEGMRLGPREGDVSRRS
jgi:AcrR family transcriptional regulator